MRKIILLPILLISLFYVTGQPTLYGISGNGNGNSVLSKYTAGANTLTAVHTFEDMGSSPNLGLVEGADGKYYGVFNNAGEHNNGFIYSFDPITSAYTKVKEFNNSSPLYEGNSPAAELVKGPDNKLYGTTQSGGTGSYGVIYCYDPLTNLYTKKRDLSYADGGNVQGPLFLSADGNFYGMGQYGGTNGYGAIFRFNPITSVYTILYSLGANDGRFSYGKLAQVGNKLYGSTANGGVNSTGVIFSFDLVTNTYQKHMDFDAYTSPYTNIKGSYSYSGLTVGSNGKLYGTTNSGGLNSRGTFFSFDPVTLIFTKLRDYNYSDGSNPQKSLLSGSDNKIYGTTQSGGTFGAGVIFSYNPASNSYLVVKHFDNSNGSGPSNLFETAGGKLISTTNSGGTFRIGVIFSFIPSTSAYTKLYEFNNPDGKEVFGVPTKGADGKLYGTTAQGGLNNYGILYSFDPATSVYTKLKDFDYATGGNPRSSLLKASNNKLYGMTYIGGSNGYGVIYSYDPVTNVYAKLRDFNYTTGGYANGNSLIQGIDGKLYGMTLYGGVNGYGVIFSFDPVTLVYTKLKDFNQTDGAYPYGSLIQAVNGKLYGLTSSGGVNGYGVMFSFDPATLVYTKPNDFDNSVGGGSPYGSLVKGVDNKLYGITSYGYNGPTIFSYDPASNIFENLASNSGNTYGSPYMASNNKLYATTYGNGSFGAGTVYSYNPISNTSNTLQSFNYDNGSYPYIGSSFVEVGNCSTLPNANISTNSPVFSPICQGSNLTLTASGGTNYIWSGPNGFSSTQQNPVINNAALTAAGSYNVQVSNGEGDCVTTKSIEVGINPKPTGTLSANGSTSFCVGGSIGLSATYGVNSQCIYSFNNNCTVTTNICSDGYSYLTNSSVSKTLNTPVATPASLQFNVYWTGYNGVMFKFYLNGNLIQTSNGTSSTFNCTPATDGNYPSAVTIPQSAYATYWNNNGSNTFKVSFSGGTCYVSAVTVLIPNPPPVSYLWSPATGLSNSAINNPIASPTTTTTYTVTASSLVGCSATQNITVTINPQPSVSISPASPVVVCSGGNSLLTANIGANSGTITSYQWYKNDVIIDNAISSTFSASQSGIYKVKVINNFGCETTSDAVSVSISSPIVVTAVASNNATGPVAPQAMVFSGPGTNVTFVGQGQVKETGGRTNMYSNINTSLYGGLWWTFTPIENPRHSSQGSSSTGQMVFNSYDPATRIITFTSTANITWPSVGHTENIATRLRMQLQPFTGTHTGPIATGLPFVTAGGISLGSLSANYPLIDIKALGSPAAYQVWYIIETASGVPLDVYYDDPAHNSIVQGQTITSQTGSFFSSTLSTCNGGPATVTVTATGGTGPYTGTGVFSAAIGEHTYTVTDANGCSGSATIDVEGQNCIELQCVENKIVSTDAGSCVATVMNIDAIITPPNAIVNYKIEKGGLELETGVGSVSGKTFGRGITTVTYTAVDEPTKTCSFTITVTDDEKPTFVCPGNQNVNLNGTCQLIVPNLIAELTGNDNCGTVTFTQSPLPGASLASSHNQTHHVLITANDGNGNTQTCTVVLTGKDVTKPTFICPYNQNVNLNGTCQLVVPNLIAGLTGSDNCGTVTFAQSPLAGASLVSSHNQTHGVVITASDGNGNIQTCTVILTGKDVTKPTFTCPGNQNVNLTATCQLVVPNLIAELTGNDNCGTVTFTQTPLAGGSLVSSHNQTHNVLITASDGNGNTETCTVVLTGKDVTKPTFTCLGNQNVNLNGTCQLIVPNFISGLTGSDNCGTVTFTQDPVVGASLASSHNQTHNVLITASDGNGNTQTCTVVLTGQDVTKPTFSCPYNQNVNLNGTCQLIVPNLISGLTGNDNCGTVTFTQSPIAGASLGSSHNQTHNVVITANDGNGNTQTCTVVLTGKDVTKPTFTCPYNRNVNLNGTCQLIVPSLISGLTGYDNCGTVTFTQNPVAGVSFASAHNQTQNVVITANDGNGNTESCTVVLTGKDVTLPVITCPSPKTISCDASILPANTGSATATDNCSGVPVITYSDVSGQDPNPSHAGYYNYTIIRTWKAMDVATNTSACNQTITVQDISKPMITCPANKLNVPFDFGQLYATIAIGTATATDNCAANANIAIAGTRSDNVVMTNQQYPFGQTTVVWSATDPSDNSEGCTQTVSVRKRNTAVTYTGDMIDGKICVQYSDIINLQAKLTDNEGLLTPNNISNRTITFQLLSGTTVLRSKSATTNASGVAVDTFKVEQAPGLYTVKTIFAGDSYFNGSNDQDNCEVKQEDAIVEYNGSQYFTTPSSTSVNGTVTFAASLNDIDDGSDKRGDIRKAKATFRDGGPAGNVLGSANLPVGLVTPGVLTNGLSATTQTYSLNTNEIGSGGKIFQVWVGASDHFTGADAGPTPVTLALPGQDFVTGGGHLVVTNSAGTYAGTVNSKMNFGFTMKWNKSGKNLQGNINIVYRKWQLYNGVWQWRVYQMKSNAINSMAVLEVGSNGQPATATNPAVFRKAIINTKANLKDVTDPLNNIDLGGNHNLTLDAWDHITANGGVSDKISVTLLGATTNELLFSSSWVSNATAAQTITGGNINVRNGSSGSSTSINSITRSGQMEVSVKEGLFVVKAYPNPTEHQFTLIVNSHLSEKIEIQLYDAVGRKIQTLSANANETIRFGEKLKTGVYIAKVIQGNKKESIKLIKQ